MMMSEIARLAEEGTVRCKSCGSNNVIVLTQERAVTSRVWQNGKCIREEVLDWGDLHEVINASCATCGSRQIEGVKS